MVTATVSDQLMFSINGPDNIGKTTQVEMLPSRWGIQKMKDVHEYNSKLATLKKTGALQEWWFRTDDEDFVDTIHTALKTRRECASHSSRPVVFDSGATMFKAVCIARIALRKEVDITSAEKVFSSLTNKLDIEWPTEDHTILITSEDLDENNVTRALKVDADPVDQYREYQVLLHHVLARQARDGSYSVIMSRSGKNCLNVHNEIFGWLRNIGIPKSWSPLLSTVSCVVGFGGLSESGKSTVATATATHFGKEGIRLKSMYFMDLASRELRSNVCDLPEDQQAFRLIQEVDRFTTSHKWLKIVCLDSLHRFSSCQALQHVLDGKLLLIYMDTEESVRFSRVNISWEHFLEKDFAKLILGADRIKEISEVIADNNGKFEDTVARVTGTVESRLIQQSKLP